MRIGGLASGMDIDAVVKQLMTAERVPLNKVNQQKQLTIWKREGYRQVSTNLVTFNNKLSNLSLSSSIDSKKAVVTGASNVLSATATGAATNSVLDIKVNHLATASNVVYTGAANATKMSDLYTGTDTSVTINGKTISFDLNDTVDSFVKKINSDKEIGVTAVFDSKTGSLSLTNKSTGSASIDVEGGLFTNNSKLTTTGQKIGSDAEVIINGITTQQASNTFTVNGIEISLNGVTPTGQSTQIEVKQDTDKMMETIKSFVDTYNETLALLNQKTNEERYRKYLPLTAEQRADMKEDEIKLWEEKAKSGMLKNDSILNKSITDMRTAMIADVVLPSGEKINLTQFGITTGNYSEKGKLIIDETKLRAALEADPEKAAALFGQTNTNATTIDNSEDGLFNRIRKINQASLQSLSEKAGTSKYSSDLNASFLPQSEMGNQLDTFERRITDLNAKLARKESQYYRQFTAMETAMSKYNSVSSSLFSMFS